MGTDVENMEAENEMEKIQEKNVEIKRFQRYRKCRSLCFLCFNVGKISILNSVKYWVSKVATYYYETKEMLWWIWVSYKLADGKVWAKSIK